MFGPYSVNDKAGPMCAQKFCEALDGELKAWFRWVTRFKQCYSICETAP
jgi:hypothetical protein